MRRNHVRWVMLRLGLAGAALLLLGAAGTNDALVLDHPRETVRWSGGPLDGVGVLAACDVGGECGVHELVIDLPAQTWQRPGGVQIGIRWADENDDLDLYVEGPGASVAAESARPVSTAESVLLDVPANGRYRVLVVPAGAKEVTYEAFAQVERPPKLQPVRELLPDLVSLPARNVKVATSAYLFDLDVPSLPNGCYPEEVIEQGARRCLRFDQSIANVGDGPFELRYRLDGIAQSQQLTQRLYGSDGSYRDRFADTYEFHPAHAHFHYTNFGQAHLWASNAAGQRLGDEPARSGRKNGFCMIDVENTWFARFGDAARTYAPPDCLTPSDLDPNTTQIAMVNGISVGWADVYNWYLADQYIDIDGLTAGHYLLETVADPAGTVLELDDANNEASVLILCENPGGTGELACRLA